MMWLPFSFVAFDYRSSFIRTQKALFILFVNSVEKPCPADAGGILEYLPRSFTTLRMPTSNQHYSRTVVYL